MKRVGLRGTFVGGVVVIAAAVTAGVTVLALVGPGKSTATPPAPVSDRVSRSTTLADAGNALGSSIAATRAQVREEPENWLAWATLGAAYVQQGRATADPTYYPKAQQALERSLAINSTANYVAMVGMGTLLAARHDFAGALQWSRRALRIDPQSAAAYSVMTDALDELGQYGQA